MRGVRVAIASGERPAVLDIERERDPKEIGVLVRVEDLGRDRLVAEAAAGFIAVEAVDENVYTIDMRDHDRRPVFRRLQEREDVILAQAVGARLERIVYLDAADRQLRDGEVHRAASPTSWPTRSNIRPAWSPKTARRRSRSRSPGRSRPLSR